ncbi:MAG: DUF6065 family protein [Sphingomonas sp.]
MELTCYVLDGWEPVIRPAQARRDWMEATPERYAYRCLPLAAANAHGWEMLSPCGFEAEWTGGPHADSVVIRVDECDRERPAPVSLFGAGTITFHTHGILRTPPGWNLWAGGSPNAAKDGIAPLAGLIEADWSPYTFTMNWRFTRPDHPVRFERDEPFVFFFPVARGTVAAAEPRIRPAAEEPGLEEAYRDWSRSRDAFHEWVKETQPKVPADQWQKLYYRGLRPDGTPGATDHESKIRPRPFGPVPATRAAPACPVAHAPAATPPVVRPRPIVSDATLGYALRQIGFDAPLAPPADPFRRK